MKLFRQTLLGLMVVSGIATAFTACDKIGLPAVNVPLTASGLTFIIPTAAAGSDSATFTYTVNIDSLVMAANSSLSTSNITSIKIDSVDIAATSGATPGNDFDNITSASLDFTSDAGSSAGITTIIAQTFTNNLSTSLPTSIKVPVNTTIDIKPYLATGNTDTHFTFKLHATLNTAVATPIGCSATVHFAILATP
jgi:hypothetical protein